MKKISPFFLLAVMIFAVLTADWHFAKLVTGTGVVVGRHITATKAGEPAIWTISVKTAEGTVHEIGLRETQYHDGCQIGDRADFRYYHSITDNFQMHVKCYKL